MPQGQSISGGITVDGKPLDVESAISLSRDAAMSGQQLSIQAILEKWASDAFEAMMGTKSKPNKFPWGHNRQENTVKILLEPGDWEVTRTDHEATTGPKTTKRHFRI